MTMREADEAAQKGLPVEHGGILYQRIYEVGYRYDKNLTRTPFVALLDKNGGSITYADPKLCTIKETKT